MSILTSPFLKHIELQKKIINTVGFALINFEFCSEKKGLAYCETSFIQMVLAWINGC